MGTRRENKGHKEELEELHFFTNLRKDKYKVKYPKELLNNIQSLIDNYCEHLHAGEACGTIYRDCGARW